MNWAEKMALDIGLQHLACMGMTREDFVRTKQEKIDTSGVKTIVNNLELEVRCIQKRRQRDSKRKNSKENEAYRPTRISRSPRTVLQHASMKPDQQHPWKRQKRCAEEK
jgi:hypothetical protein